VTGGIGGAKLALGLHRVLPPGALACVVNTGDDFTHLGLHVSPDLDTTLYTLAGCEDPEPRLGTPRRDLDVHARARGTGWRDLVPTRRW
jgi:LPPG:FO 2-phospho-L-lactate transferase